MSKYRVQVGSFAVDFAYDVSVSQVSALNAIRDVLQDACTGTSSSVFEPGKIVGRIIKKSNAAVLVDRFSVGNYVNRLTLTMESWTYKLYINNDDNNVSLWNGSLANFNANTTFKTILTNLKDKLVRFKYAGGSDPGETRLVKVKYYEGGMLHGTDLVKNSHRQFDPQKITALEEVKL